MGCDFHQPSVHTHTHDLRLANHPEKSPLFLHLPLLSLPPCRSPFPAHFYDIASFRLGQRDVNPRICAAVTTSDKRCHKRSERKRRDNF
ncbi:unnamed protein product [Rodentolepis nana]|uniref:Uncharacterized protein n=1 Tax=Rodentolepis nana TaxID=102285 RepID=A0A0R3TD66_RODNA|nr:unnamed protein product [Rodentolepis nana]